MKEKLQSLKKVGFTILAFLGFVNFASAQCAGGEVEVNFDISTDTWGYELYWELVPTGAGCGTPATIFAGGNTNVGCAGGGLQVAADTDPGAYGNSTVVSEGPFCLTIGNQYDIIMVDDWADGGHNFTSNDHHGIDYDMASAGNDTYTFTAMALPATPDAKTTANPVEYTIYPLSQVGNIVNTANIENVGAGDATGVTVTVNVYELTGMTQVYTETSAPATVAQGANLDFNFTGFTPSSVNNYYVEYFPTITEVDANMANDTVGYLVQVDDSVYARDVANITGVTGIAGIGTGSGGYCGIMLNVVNQDTLTGINTFISNQNGALNGTNLVAKLFSWTGTASTEITSTVTVLLDSGVNKNTMHELELVGGPQILAPGMYVIAVEEGATNASIGSTVGVYTTNGILVNAFTFTTDFQDQAPLYGGNEINFVVRGVFGTPDMPTAINELTTNAWEVYPNPAVDNISVKNAVLGSTVEIFNNLGQLVHTEVIRSNNVTINVADFDNGVYTIKNTSNENVSTQSFVKQ